jgi:protein-disulfide isomerase
MSDSIPWYKRPIVWLLIILILSVLGWMVYVGMLTLRYVQLGKRSPEALRQERYQASISKVFERSATLASDLKRIESTVPQPTLGNPGAKVRIIEFIDYDCPFCKESAPAVRSFMKKHQADAFFILRDLPLVDIHPDAEEPAIAARCVFLQGSSEKFWRYHDRLFVTQGAHEPEQLELYAQQVGANLETYRTCVKKRTPIKDIEASLDDGVAAGAAGTPTFFFNGVKIQGALDEAALEVAFQEALKRVK